MKEYYKSERFRDKSFPVYSSQQKGTGILVVPHFHKAAELIRVTEGRITLYIHGQSHSCSAGDIVFLPPYSVHSAVCEEGNASIRGLVFELSLIGADVCGLSPEKILNKTVVAEHIFKPQEGIYPALVELLGQAVDAYDCCGATYKLEILSALHGIIAQLVNNYFRRNVDYANYNRLQPVIDYIGQNYQRELSLSELSGILNICDDHLIRLFKSATGKTPVKYIMELRLQEALKLLTDTEFSVTECADRVGFSSVNYMSRVFRANLNTTPGQFRKMNRKGNAK